MIFTTQGTVISTFFKIFYFFLALGNAMCCNGRSDRPDEAIDWLGQGLIREIPVQAGELPRWRRQINWG
jgi:hypothetical protein